MKKHARLLVATATTLALGGGLAAVAPAASADAEATSVKCNNSDDRNYKTYDLPGKTDIIGVGNLCITRYSNGRMTATIRFLWGEASLPAVGSGHKFDNFDIHVRLERRPNGSSTDSTVAKRTCDVTTEVNASWSDEVACGISEPDVYNSAYDWSTDGYLSYDIDNDGKGGSTFALYGSPLIK